VTLQDTAAQAVQGLSVIVDAGTMVALIGLVKVFVGKNGKQHEEPRNGKHGHGFTAEDRAALNNVVKALDRLTDRLERWMDATRE
jgi:hypothetical protein